MNYNYFFEDKANTKKSKKDKRALRSNIVIDEAQRAMARELDEFFRKGRESDDDKESEEKTSA